MQYITQTTQLLCKAILEPYRLNKHNDSWLGAQIICRMNITLNFLSDIIGDDDPLTMYIAMAGKFTLTFQI